MEFGYEEINPITKQFFGINLFLLFNSNVRFKPHTFNVLTIDMMRLHCISRYIVILSFIFSRHYDLLYLSLFLFSHMVYFLSCSLSPFFSHSRSRSHSHSLIHFTILLLSYYICFKTLGSFYTYASVPIVTAATAAPAPPTTTTKQQQRVKCQIQYFCK